MNNNQIKIQNKIGKTKTKLIKMWWKQNKNLENSRWPSKHRAELNCWQLTFLQSSCDVPTCFLLQVLVWPWPPGWVRCCCCCCRWPPCRCWPRGDASPRRHPPPPAKMSGTTGTAVSAHIILSVCLLSGLKVQFRPHCVVTAGAFNHQPPTCRFHTLVCLELVVSWFLACLNSLMGRVLGGMRYKNNTVLFPPTQRKTALLIKISETVCQRKAIICATFFYLVLLFWR